MKQQQLLIENFGQVLRPPRLQRPLPAIQGRLVREIPKRRHVVRRLQGRGGGGWHRRTLTTAYQAFDDPQLLEERRTEFEL